MGITDFGRIIHAQAMAGQTFHLAWGGFPAGYPDPWSLGQTPPTSLSNLGTATQTRSASSTQDSLVQLGVFDIVSVKQGATTYQKGVSFQLSANAVDWSIAGANPQPAAGSTYTVVYRYHFTAVSGLLNEVGRRSPLLVGYAFPDVNGAIVANGSSWTYTTSPTSNVYLQFKFDPADGVGTVISQVGIFLGTVPTIGTTPGTQYLLPAQIGNEGQLYMLDNVEPFTRFAGKREIYEYVISY